MDLTPAEFSDIHAKWAERERARDENEWFRARWMVFKTLCPPDKKMINIFDIEKFPWETTEHTKEVPISNRELFEAAKKKYGQRLQTGNRDRSKR